MNAQDIHQQAQLLLSKARDDALVVNSHGTHGESFSDSIYGFHAQQAVEKTIKAALWLQHGEAPAFTHDLVKLWQSLSSDAHGFPVSSEMLAQLAPYAVIYRYDAEEEGEPVSIAEMQSAVNAMLAWAQDVVDAKTPV